jgi:hypothetical protein
MAADNYLNSFKNKQLFQDETSPAVTNVNSLYKPVEAERSPSQFLLEPGESYEQPVGQAAVPPVNASAPTAPVSNALLRGQRVQTLTPGETEIPDRSFENYWGQKVGQTNIPLDQFVRLAGMAAHAFAPDEASGRLGQGLAEMGKESYQERIKRAQDTPNELLKRQLLRAQIGQAERKDPATEWQDFKEAAVKAGETDLSKVYERFKKSGRVAEKPFYHYVEDKQGNVSVFEGSKLISGTGKGKDVSKDVGSHEVDDRGIITFFDKQGSPIGKTTGGKTKVQPGVAEGIRRGYSAKDIQADLENAKKEPIVRFKDNTIGVLDKGTGQYRQATPEEATGARRPVKEGKKKGIFSRDKNVPSAQYTEQSLRTQLTEAKKKNSSIDIEKAMKAYKAKGLY